MASEPASERQTGGHTPAARKVKAAMLGDLERVRAALRSGARPQQLHCKNSMTKRCLKPETIAHGPDGDVLIPARWGRVTLLGRLWDKECAEHARGLCVQMGEDWVSRDNKGAIAPTTPDATDCRPNVQSPAA